MKKWTKAQAWGCPCHPKKYSRGTSVKAWGCPCIPSSSIKVPSHLSMRYIFIASYTMCYSWSIFIFVCCFLQFSFCFVCCNKWLDPIIRCLGGDTLRLITQNTLVFTFIRSTSVLVCLYFVQLWFFTLIYVQSFAQFSLFRQDQLSDFC